jgi:hypothetical protein
MKKSPESLKVLGVLKDKLDNYNKTRGDSKDEYILYDGPVRQLCPLAPNNVNTMAAGKSPATSCDPLFFLALFYVYYVSSCIFSMYSCSYSRV